jgi:hypothetical protein
LSFSSLNLEVTGILGELFWSHVIMDNTIIEFRWNGIVDWRFCVSPGVRLVVSSIHLVRNVEKKLWKDAESSWRTVLDRVGLFQVERPFSVL